MRHRLRVHQRGGQTPPETLELVRRRERIQETVPRPPKLHRNPAPDPPRRLHVAAGSVLRNKLSVRLRREWLRVALVERSRSQKRPPTPAASRTRHGSLGSRELLPKDTSVPSQPVARLTRRSSGDASRLNRASARRFQLRFGRNRSAAIRRNCVHTATGSAGRLAHRKPQNAHNCGHAPSHPP